MGNDTYFVRNAGDIITNESAGVDTVNTTLLSYTLAANLENLTFNGTGNFTGTGNQFANIITGGAGNDRFVATVGDGNDTYNGGLGTDTYDLSGTTAGATVNLGLGTSTSANTGTDTLTSIENVIGGSGNDTFVASVGDGNNSYNGGAGTDTYDLSATTADATVNLALGTASSLDVGTDTLTSIENVIGGGGNDTLVGDAQNNVLIGGAGDDTLNGGVGADAMSGGLGNDTYIVDNAGDVVTEAVGEGTDTVNTTLGSYTLGANVENLNFTGAGNFAGTGNTLANVIVGGAGNDTLDDGGVGGADTLNGGAGNDTYFVRNAGERIIDSGVGVNTVNTTLLSYTLASNLQNLTFIGSGDFTGTGNQFANVITGGAGNDRFVATVGDGNDTYDGRLGHRYLRSVGDHRRRNCQPRTRHIDERQYRH